VKRGALLSALALLLAPPGSSVAGVPSPRLLERGDELGLYSLAGNPAGGRLVVVSREFPPDGPRLDVFDAPPAGPFGSASRATGPVFDTVAALGPDGTAAILGTPPSRSGTIGSGLIAVVRPPGAGSAETRTLTPASIDDPFVAFDRQGNAMALWIRSSNGTSDESFVEESTRPHGGDWSAPVGISHELHSTYRPQVAFDAVGDAIAVWVRTPHNKAEVVASMRPTGGSFGPPEVISDPRFDSDEPSLSVNAAGEAGVVWVQLTKNDAHFQVGGAFRTRGQPFGPPQLFTAARAEATGASVALDDQGAALLTWRIPYRKAGDGVNAFWIKVAHRPPGGPLSRAVRVGGPWTETGQLAVAPSGRGKIAWIYNGLRHDLVQARNVTTTGGVGPVRQISPFGTIGSLHLTIDDSAATTFAWTRRRHHLDRLETIRR